MTSSCQNTFTPTQSGTYQVNVMIVRRNICGADTTYIQKSIYVALHPLPVVSAYVSISGNNILCPGGSNLLIASGTPFTWSGTGVTGNTNDSVYINQPGTYSVSSSLTATTPFGCTASSSAYNFINVSYPPQPVVSINNSNGVICPGD